MSKEYIVKGTYTYKVQKKIKAKNEKEAMAIAGDVDPLCEWDSQDQDTYSEAVDTIEENEEQLETKTEEQRKDEKRGLYPQYEDCSN